MHAAPNSQDEFCHNTMHLPPTRCTYRVVDSHWEPVPKPLDFEIKASGRARACNLERGDCFAGRSSTTCECLSAGKKRKH